MVVYLVQALDGSWDDVTLRAVRILEEASLVVAWDVEQAKELLRHYGVHTPLLGLGEGEEGVGSLLDGMSRGDVAWLWSESSDLEGSSWRLVRTLAEHDVLIVPIPGPSRIVTALVTCGLPATGFTFIGTLAREAEDRRHVLEGVVEEQLTVVCEVSIADLVGVLKQILALLGDRAVAVEAGGRMWHGRASDTPPAMPGGGCMLVIGGAGEPVAWSEERVRAAVREMLAQGCSARDVAHAIATRSGWSRRQVYVMCHLVAREGI